MLTEARVKEIWSTEGEAQFGLSLEDCRKADEWIKVYACKVFLGKTKNYPKPIRDYLVTMVRCHFGSVETDELLIELGCYPEWMGAGKAETGR